MTSALQLTAVILLLLVVCVVAHLVRRVRQLHRWQDNHQLRHDVLARLSPVKKLPPEPWKRERARTNADPSTSRRPGLR